MQQLQKHVVCVVVLSTLVCSPCAWPQAEMFDGKPAFAQGVELGYFVWKDGQTWHFRWTTMGRMRRFSGSVTAEGGKLKSLKRIDVETERRVLYPGRSPRVVWGPRGRPHVRGGRGPVVVERQQDKIEKDGDNRILFATRTNDDIDGFDFKVDKVKSLRLVLEIDGQLQPGHVEVGRSNQKIPRLPFVIQLD